MTATLSPDHHCYSQAHTRLWKSAVPQHVFSVFSADQGPALRACVWGDVQECFLNLITEFICDTLCTDLSICYEDKRFHGFNLNIIFKRTAAK